MKKYVILAVLAAVMLTGCAQTPAPTEPLTEQTESPWVQETTIAETLPIETIRETIVPAVTEPEEEAEQIREGMTVSVGFVDHTKALSDGSPYTQATVQTGLRVESEEAFSALYLSWDTLPGAYSITWEGGSLRCGEENFYHDYIRLPQAVRSVELQFPEGAKNRLCELELYTHGRAPAAVQDWLPPCEQADILVFPTHSDDDVLFFGPLIAYYAVDRGLDVQTAFMVEHKQSPERVHERLNGLWELGVRHYPILGTAPDAGTHSFEEAMGIYARCDILGWQVEQIRRFRPSVIVGHDLEGEYGNGGHKVNAHFLTQAVEAAADPDAPDAWDTPKLYLHLYEENSISLDVNTPVASDGRTPFEMAVDAFKHHKSQNRSGLAVLQGDEYPRYDCTRFGLYRTTVGSDTGADIMENIEK